MNKKRKELDSKQLHQRTRFNTVMVSNANYSYSTKQNICNSRGIKRGLTAGVAWNVFLSSRKLSLPSFLIEKIVQLI